MAAFFINTHRATALHIYIKRKGHDGRYHRRIVIIKRRFNTSSFAYNLLDYRRKRI